MQMWGGGKGWESTFKFSYTIKQLDNGFCSVSETEISGSISQMPLCANNCQVLIENFQQFSEQIYQVGNSLLILRMRKQPQKDETI